MRLSFLPLWIGDWRTAHARLIGKQKRQKDRRSPKKLAQVVAIYCLIFDQRAETLRLVDHQESRELR